MADGTTGGTPGGTAGRTRPQPPFHCPYCGEEDLTPYGDDAASWHCGACLRTFTVRLTGTGVTLE